MKTLILYYSRTRKTALVAKTLAEEIQADIVEFRDLKNRMGILNYLRASLDAMREKKTTISPDTIELQNYELVYIGTPVWAGKPAPAITTLIDNCNLKGKKVILFITMGGSGGESTIERMREKVKARGGQIVNSFFIKTGGKEIREISEDTKKIIEELGLKDMQNK